LGPTANATEHNKPRDGGQPATLCRRVRRTARPGRTRSTALWPRYTNTVFIADGIGLVVAIVVAGLLLGTSSGLELALTGLYAPLTMLLVAYRGSLRARPGPRALTGIGESVRARIVAGAVLIVAADALEPSLHLTPVLGVAAAVACLWAVLVRFAVFLLQGVRQAPTRLSPAIVVGAGRVGAHVERRLRERPELGLVAVGYLDDDPLPAEEVPERSGPVLGSLDDLRGVLGATGARHVIVAFSSAPDSALNTMSAVCSEYGAHMAIVPRLFENLNRRARVEYLGALPVVVLESFNPKTWQFAVKHAIDRVVGIALLLAAMPLLLALAAAVKHTSPGPVFFRQRRVGRDGREFDMLKFRTMSGSPERDGEADAGWKGNGGTERAEAAVDRRTPVGRFLRRHSLDELPQLINIVRGDMSLVGPRPERSAYVREFEQTIPGYARRHRVKCGLTGWAQVNGLRGQTPLDDRVEWDNYYVENWSLALDLKIMLLTLLEVVRPRGE
jgi:exopolysaccharide biosynthesis polyprenyl glycosylphosphotransferase